MALATPLLGADMYAAMSTLIDGFSMDSTLFYQLLNAERAKIEFMRPWQRLMNYQFSQTIGPVSTAPVTLPPASTSRITIPTDFSYFSHDGEMVLYDNNSQWETFTEIPLWNAIPYLSANNVFYSDHAHGYFYLLGCVSKQYTAYLVYQADWGDITATTTWLNIPARYHMILPLRVAVRERLGIDYDDINQINADDNARAATEILDAMKIWDDNLARSATTRRDLPDIADVPGSNFNHRIPILG